MLAMTLRDLANAVGGSLCDADPDALVTGPAHYDSRLIGPGGLFAAFEGKNVDGHRFAGRAMANGAAAVLATRPVGVPAVLVGDVQGALGKLATTLIDRACDLNVVGITGSVGKTTTKDLLGHILAQLSPTVAPPGNFNNEIGLPTTVSLITANTRYLVCELGARNVGDIAYLANIVKPRVGVVTNVGVSHLSEFGSLENTSATKAELVDALPADGRAVLNADDPRVASMAESSIAPVTLFGTGAAAEIRPEDVDTDLRGRASFRLCTPTGSAPVALRLIGQHYVLNALAAAAAALQFTDDVAFIADALSHAERVSAGRMHVVEMTPGITVINDAYNASPTSTSAALATAGALSQGRRLIAVLGQMNELGPDSTHHHTELGRCAAAAGVRYLIGVGGPDAQKVVSAAQAGGVQVDHVADANTALDLLRSHCVRGDVVLIKGSNAVGLQSLVEGLAADCAGCADIERDRT